VILIVGAELWTREGKAVGDFVGAPDSTMVGKPLGTSVGLTESVIVGVVLGPRLGEDVVGSKVGSALSDKLGLLDGGSVMIKSSCIWIVSNSWLSPKGSFKSNEIVALGEASSAISAPLS